MEYRQEIMEWLLQGDVSIQFQVRRDLLDQERPDLQGRVELEGWGARFLARRRPDGHWGKSFYQPKWTNSHYTLLDLKTLQLPQTNEAVRETIALIAREQKSDDGGINPGKTIKESDVCINGMFLNYACYFGIDEQSLHSIVDFVIDQHMHDGGFNCRLNRSGAVHSSMHSTISVLEGIREYERRGYSYRLEALKAAAAAGREFLLLHRLYLSDRTGEVIDPKYLMLSFPGRWRYDILRALEYFRDASIVWDERMRPALEVLLKKRRRDGRWPLQARHPGQTHFEMEKPGQPSRWNTLRALRVLRTYGDNIKPMS
ncbi:MAG: hypothetical protein P8X64_10320 [Anaerolineales bacterium]